MSILFKVEGRKVVPHTETLLTPPFKEIWERDESKDKEYAIEDYTYMEFLTSQKKSNPYAGYDDTLRRERVFADIITREGWKEDPLIVQGLKKIIEFQKEASITYSYYMNARTAANKIQDFFVSFNMNDVNVKTGNPLYKPKEITASLTDTGKVLQELNSMREKVEQELFETTKLKGQKEISPFAISGFK